MSKTSIWARKQARRALVQAVYRWQLNGANASDIQKEFLEDGSLKNADVVFFGDALRRVIGRSDLLDEQFKELLDRELDDLDPVELGILRLGTDELLHRPDVPYRVVIDEYVELAKVFGAEESFKYVNGVLDKLSRRLRTLETAARR
ncbi:MAG: transcription antitermination factor NusB [Pseudomonadales bacterium]|nr:transcription antitermination factor NusB [Pseudomonadales bacterium]